MNIHHNQFRIIVSSDIEYEKMVVYLRVTLNEVKIVFDDLINQKKSREEIKAWAYERQRAHDDDNLIFEPNNEKPTIWRGIIYLTGVDLEDFDGGYLHSIENFIDFREKCGL